MSWFWSHSFIMCCHCFMIYWSWCMFWCFVWVCLNLLWLSDFHWPTSLDPNKLKFGMLIMLWMMFDHELFEDLLKCLWLVLSWIILLTSLRFYMTCLDLICLRNDNDEWYEHETTWVCFLIVWTWFWTLATCCFDFLISFWP